MPPVTITLRGGSSPLLRRPSLKKNGNNSTTMMTASESQMARSFTIAVLPRPRTCRTSVAAVAHSVVPIVQSEVEERNALGASIRSKWSMHAPRPAPIDIVILESEVGHWGWVWQLAHSDWSAHACPPALGVIS
ncbi:hypothetical protein K438DRAFT_1980271 [Mycena galopus ATCC 62051]|nr:hypothetical protein K438DRAFT_1980271 [Mycena galopus ATCC 62051]